MTYAPIALLSREAAAAAAASQRAYMETRGYTLAGYVAYYRPLVLDPENIAREHHQADYTYLQLLIDRAHA